MTLEEKRSYALGAAIGSNYATSGLKFDAQALARGFNAVGNREALEISPDEIQRLLQDMQTEIENNCNTDSKKEMEKGEAFLAENRKKEGVVETASGLQYKLYAKAMANNPPPRIR